MLGRLAVKAALRQGRQGGPGNTNGQAHGLIIQQIVGEQNFTWGEPCHISSQSA